MIAGLSNAPADIIETIAKHLDLPTLKTLRLVSHGVHDQFSSITLRNIAFRISGQEGNVPRLLDACSKPLPALYQYGRHLTVETRGWYVAQYVDNKGIQGLYKTIEQFKNLASFEITWGSGIDGKKEMATRVHEIQERIVDAVFKVTEGKLDKLIIDPWREQGYDLPKKLKKFSVSRHLEFTWNEQGWGCNGLTRSQEKMGSHKCIPSNYKDTLLAIVRNSPGLDVFQLVHGCAVDFYDASVLFGPTGTANRNPLALRVLSIKGVRFPYTIKPQHSPFTYLRHLKVLTRYTFIPCDNLWRSLQAVGTTLETLETHQVTLPLCSYLASYSGLQKLIVKELEDVPECVSPNVTTAFFNDVLPRHSSSLTTLFISFRINTHYLHGWSFDPKLSMHGLRSLTALQSLHLPAVQEDRHFVYGMRDDFVRGYQEIIDRVEELPQLHTLEIVWPDKTFGCGTAHREWRVESVRTLSEVVKQLRSRSGVPKVLMLLSGRYSATKIEGDDGWCFTSTHDAQI